MKILRYFILSALPFLFFSCSEVVNIKSEIENKPLDTLPIIICSRPLEISPKYRNGTNEELMQIIYSQLEYPNEKCVQGITVLSVHFDEKGKIESTKIYRSLSKAIDNQLETLIRKYEFEPGTFDGKPQKFQINFPFKIELD